ncbi:hypothetical protein D3C85_1374300 [compost metagenome]
MDAHAAGQADQAAQHGVEEARLDQRGDRPLAEGGGLGEQDGHRRDEDHRKTVVAHHRRLHHEGQQHHRQGDAPGLERQQEQPPGDQQADGGAEQTVQLLVPYRLQRGALDHRQATDRYPVGLLQLQELGDGQ